MGKIIAAESIAKETYPQPGDHERVAQEFMAVAETVPSLYAATVYGSTALKSARRRSDVDIAVAHTQEDITGFFTGLQNTFQALPYGNLIETHIISQEGLRDGEIHDGDIFLAEHLRLATHESPIPGIRSQVFASMPDRFATLPPHESLALGERIIESYLHHKQRKFFNALRHGDDPHYNRLQRAFELPTAITRKLVRLETLREKSYNAAFKADFYDKDSLTRQSRQLAISNSDWQASST